MGIRSAKNPSLTDSERRWGLRIERAQALQETQQAFTTGLRLYEATLNFQRDVACTATAALNADQPLRSQIDLSFACSRLPALLTVAGKYGPDALRERAISLRHASDAARMQLFESAPTVAQPEQDNIDDFFVRACLQPFAENLQRQLPSDRNYTGSICPACGGLPQLAVLRPEGEGASRYLLCSFCLREWLFRRIICPFCGEENKEKLPRYSAEQCTHVYVESCDACMHYFKAVDMNMDGHAEPLVDEAAVAVLDMWAVEHGYKKVVPNLIGF